LKVKITLAYDGSAFMGSQIQKSTSQTVMGVFQKALKQLSITDTAIASGRTDRDVHASAQVLHVTLPPFWNDLEKLKRSLNFQLTKSLHVKRIEVVEDSFHARYSAKRRVYRYILCEGESNPFESRYVTFKEKLDFEKIQHAIALFVGEYDFKNFMKQGSESGSSVRTIYKAYAYKRGEKIILTFEANGYLRSQIRMMVAFLLQISDDKLSAKELQEQLTCKALYSRKLAPPQGLYLAKIRY
jgi:tRNA pseudouridine38-40 synthase